MDDDDGDFGDGEDCRLCGADSIGAFEHAGGAVWWWLCEDCFETAQDDGDLW